MGKIEKEKKQINLGSVKHRANKPSDLIGDLLVASKQIPAQNGK